MNWSKKNLYMFFYLINEPNSKLNLNFLIAKWVNFKHNNAVMNKLARMRHNLKVYNNICLYVYTQKYKNNFIDKNYI